MLKQVYFIHQDSGASDRQSDGVELCIIPSLDDNKIYFYCHEYMSFWQDIKNVGDLNKCVHLSHIKDMRPATLEEICKNGMIGLITCIKEYNYSGNKISNINYIHL